LTSDLGENKDAAAYHRAMERMIGVVIGVLFGVGMIVIGAARPDFAWNHEMLAGMRSSLGDVLVAVFLIGAGILMIGSSLVMAKRKAR
jgi:hypothetical protein